MNSILAASAVVLFASWTSNALAGNSQTAVNSGTIHFQGRIVESPCESELQQKQKSLQVSCLRNGQMKTSTIALNTTSASQSLPHDIGRSQLAWIDAGHKLGVMTMEYH